MGPVDELGSGGTFEALPTPLGSLTELLLPPALPGPAGTPLTPVVPAPAEPAGGVPVELPAVAPAADPPADPPVPCARAAIGSIRLAAAAIAIRFDFFDISFLHIVDWVNGPHARFFPCRQGSHWKVREFDFEHRSDRPIPVPRNGGIPFALFDLAGARQSP